MNNINKLLDNENLKSFFFHGYLKNIIYKSCILNNHEIINNIIRLLNRLNNTSKLDDSKNVSVALDKIESFIYFPTYYNSKPLTSSYFKNNIDININKRIILPQSILEDNTNINIYLTLISTDQNKINNIIEISESSNAKITNSDISSAIATIISSEVKNNILKGGSTSNINNKIKYLLDKKLYKIEIVVFNEDSIKNIYESDSQNKLVENIMNNLDKGYINVDLTTKYLKVSSFFYQTIKYLYSIQKDKINIIFENVTNCRIGFKYDENDSTIHIITDAIGNNFYCEPSEKKDYIILFYNDNTNKTRLINQLYFYNKNDFDKAYPKITCTNKNNIVLNNLYFEDFPLPSNSLDDLFNISSDDTNNFTQLFQYNLVNIDNEEWINAISNIIRNNENTEIQKNIKLFKQLLNKKPDILNNLSSTFISKLNKLAISLDDNDDYSIKKLLNKGSKFDKEKNVIMIQKYFIKIKYLFEKIVQKQYQLENNITTNINSYKIKTFNLPLDKFNKSRNEYNILYSYIKSNQIINYLEVLFNNNKIHNKLFIDILQYIDPELNTNLARIILKVIFYSIVYKGHMTCFNIKNITFLDKNIKFDTKCIHNYYNNYHKYLINNSNPWNNKIDVLFTASLNKKNYEPKYIFTKNVEVNISNSLPDNLYLYWMYPDILLLGTYTKEIPFNILLNKMNYFTRKKIIGGDKKQYTIKNKKYIDSLLDIIS